MHRLALIIEHQDDRHPEFAGIAVKVEAAPEPGDVLVLPRVKGTELTFEDSTVKHRPLAFEVPERVVFVPADGTAPGHYIAWRKVEAAEIEDGNLFMYSLENYGFSVQPILRRHTQPSRLEAATAFLQRDDWRPTPELLGFVRELVNN